MAASVEKYTVRGITFHYIHLGQHRVEVLLGHHDKPLRESLHKATSQSSHTTGKTNLEKTGNLICRMVPKAKGEFQKLLRKVFNMMANKIERYYKKAGNMQAKADTRRKSRTKKNKGYHHRGALTA